ncbi:MAG: right-handed parallel beta-helix repeat-containing protein, partial [Candidatus Aenigmarchaeota archaeon]|nr:right-handed parallel beta-helix repeat-containing protein [Candidatus Aenigmarchaeota archaeon]
MRRGKILLLCILMMIPSANALVIDYTTEFQNTIEIAALLNYCNNCTDCSEKIQNANYGDTVRLTANITNHDGTCIEFNDADGIIFDGGNHLIDGDEDTNGYGISLAGYSNSNTLINCKITGFYHGIYLNTASHNTMQNITAYSNRNGIAIFYSGYNKIRDCILQENSRHDFYFVPNTLSNCDNTLVNVTSSGNRPISFYNQSVNLQDQEFSAIYLCNADNSVLNNITIKGSDIRKNNGLRIYYTDNSNMTDVVSSDNYEGINIDNSDSNNLQNITCINDYYGINLYDS